MPYPRSYNTKQVVISPRILSFFYSMTKDGDVSPVLKRFQMKRTAGRVLQEDKINGAVQVMFHQASKPLWLKYHEVEFRS